MRRHDLVWLDPGAPPRQWHAAPGDTAELGAWIARRLPLVVARRPAAPPPGRENWIALGFTLPGRGPRRRITVAASPAAIACRRPPLSLDEAIEHAPGSWRTGMQDLLRACRTAGLAARVYGSIATQIFCREPCLRPDSDLDLLMDCADNGRVRAALALLRAFAPPRPRLDGELRLANGWAVAWRELAAAIEGPPHARVMAKSDTAVALVAADQLLAAKAGPGDALGNDRPAACSLSA